MVIVLILTSSFVIVKNGEYQCSLPQNKTTGLHYKNMEAMTEGTEGGGRGPVPFTLTPSIFKFTSSQDIAAAIVNLTTILVLSLPCSQELSIFPASTTIPVFHLWRSIVSSDPPHWFFFAKVINHHFIAKSSEYFTFISQLMYFHH